MWSSLKRQLSAALRGEDEERSRTHGFHVLRVAEGSVADKAGIESYYDFICEVDGVELTEDFGWLSAYLSGADRPLRVVIWSLKDRMERCILLLPSEHFGLSLRWCSIGVAQKVVWHVLSIEAGSPAEVAGLFPYDDYIVGTPDCLLRSESDLGTLIDNCMNQSLSLYVYNRHRETTRLVILMPNRKWGGSGALGCGLGYGYLHRLPGITRKKIEPASKISETFVYEELQDRFGIPLTETEKMLGVPSNSQLTPQTKLKTKSRKTNKVFDDEILELMREGEEKSQEIERKVVSVPPQPVSQETTD
ncbi:hypothetical protein T552_02931 [Pneumocystis carinii B80]|uniref:PDZ GRASP-type domain-containing protein n=1 Tax=Pneumocystis carinii (strain B80) TaxID=1408658 RepID=A0A0W4ZDH8_PNEC8|nr:hypothetical protein T552_02931 [Pneumocystis carinii B80]KTW26452.1 hypothetical protein T552_02931 [Pneumocystis carinii B80]